MSRRLAREIALRSLFQVDAGKTKADEAVEYNATELAASDEAAKYARMLVEATLANLPQIDGAIRQHAIDWAFERLAGTDKAILRISVCELKHMAEAVPASVVVNEAVELAKLYGDEASGRFVNGVLGAILRAQQPEQTARS